MAYNPFRNFGLKMLALAVAALLWFTMAGDYVVERIAQVPLEMRNRPERLELVGNPPDQVEVRLRGSSGLLSRLQTGDVVAILDLEAARPGSRLFHLRTDQVRTPFGVTVSQVIPQTINLAFELGESREVPIRADVEGEPAPGYVLGRITVTPASVEVIGPSSDLHALRDATTEPVVVDGLSRNVEETVTVGVDDSALRLREPLSATVRVEILPAPIERTFGTVRVEPRNTPGGAEADVAGTVLVAVRGGREALAQLDASQVVAYVDLAGLGPGRYNLPVRIDPSRAFGVSRVEPAVVEVRIR
ncbi:MAG TPA: CdaR family protein [Vicinamibacterales bacterium]|nr:CdaR family protein [Vicinamibacterales bacterium]